MESEKQLLYRKEKEDSVYRLPCWILGWFYTSVTLCIWDATFIMCRPHSLPGGSLSFIWKPYKYYITVDQRYADVNDPFVFGISLFNCLEVILNIVTIILHYRSSRHTIPLAFTVSVMTFWKTLFYLYAFSDCGGGAPYRVGNSALQEFFIFVVPNGIWILVPFAVMMALWPRMVPEVSDASQGNGTQVRSSRVSKKQA
ncbi:hypothetical protein C0Q70_05505 [Pomacea canaliculata]|uniref:EXPERA domain-containing protein n=1 Tax=Pomacea canaliculata TaxID=400727 RepID=A0A2T7PLH6_POMCA|nr:uncharacterized protein LOC112558635 [Pomacea canaliculata]XP_025084992.1 uncharacterized protein LOC112558635 [Pomacea canaliculata]PVD34237.1 hypothetical protein C0Q70_05505 [Pomacea canaliculata]